LELKEFRRRCMLIKEKERGGELKREKKERKPREAR